MPAVKKPSTKILTANRLREGDVVYLDASGAWTTDFASALVVEDGEEEARRLAEAERDVAARLVVAPYFFPVAVTEKGAAPISQRERIRARGGPTVGSSLRHQAACGS